MNIPKYLERIKANAFDTLDLKGLTYLQKQHLLAIPFENLDIHLGKKIVLDYDMIYEKVVIHKRGGFCYELNGLFYLLLKKLGYTVKRISARVRGDSGRIGKEGDHLAIIVSINDEAWLVDVGFGKFSFLPLKIQLDEVQYDGRQEYKISKYDDTYHGVFIKEASDAWRLGYLFTLDHRVSTFFDSMCHYQQTSSETNFTKRRMITIPKSDGRVTLTDTKLKILKDGITEESSIDSEAMFQDKLRQYFQMEYVY